MMPVGQQEPDEGRERAAEAACESARRGKDGAQSWLGLLIVVASGLAAAVLLFAAVRRWGGL